MLATLLNLHCKISPSFYEPLAIDFIKQAFLYTIKLGKLDLHFDVRDQSRFLEDCFGQLQHDLYPRLFDILGKIAPVITLPTPEGINQILCRFRISC